MKKLYVPKEAGDPLSSQDWNSLQEQIQKDLSGHRHTGAFDGNAHFVNGSLGFNRVPQNGDLPEGGNASGGRYQLTPRPDRITLESYTTAGAASGGLSILAANGNVGIGRTKPDAPLDVAGENGIRTRVHSGAGNWAGIRNDDQNAYIETFTVNASKYPQNLILKPAGKVGIGTIAPATTLHTVGHVAATNGDSNTFVQLWSDNALIWRSGTKHAGLRFGSASNLAAGEWSEKMRITDAGNLGVGTQKPREKIDVWGGALYVTGADHNGTAFITSSAGTAYFSNNSMTNGLAIAKNGNIGMGTENPGYKLEVKGILKADNVATSSDFRFKSDIQPLNDVMDRLLSVRGVSYRDNRLEMGDGRRLGVIAQELEEVFPELVITDPDGFKAVSYQQLVVPLLEALKEQQRVISHLQEDVRRLQQAQKG